MVADIFVIQAEEYVGQYRPYRKGDEQTRPLLPYSFSDGRRRHHDRTRDDKLQYKFKRYCNDSKKPQTSWGIFTGDPVAWS